MNFDTYTFSCDFAHQIISTHFKCFVFLLQSILILVITKRCFRYYYAAVFFLLLLLLSLLLLLLSSILIVEHFFSRLCSNKYRFKTMNYLFCHSMCSNIISLFLFCCWAKCLLFLVFIFIIILHFKRFEIEILFVRFIFKYKI